MFNILSVIHQHINVMNTAVYGTGEETVEQGIDPVEALFLAGEVQSQTVGPEKVAVAAVCIVGNHLLLRTIQSGQHNMRLDSPVRPEYPSLQRQGCG